MSLRTALAVLPLCLPSLASAEPAGDIAPVETLLLFPADGQVDVPANVSLFVQNATAVLLVEDATAREIHALLDPTSGPSWSGSRFVPTEGLSAGLHRVLAQPTADAWTFEGEGVAVEIGSFSARALADDDGPDVLLESAVWTRTVDCDDCDEINVSAQAVGQPAAEPFRIEIDLSDTAAVLDGVADGTGSWQTSSFASIDVPGSPIDPASAIVRARASDAAGNSGAWSAPISVVLQTIHPPSDGGCSAAPRSRSAPSTLAWTLAAGILGVWRRSR